MKTLIVSLIIASFLQSTILPLDLVLIILICRALIKEDKENLYLAFAFGLFIAHLNGHLLGFQSVIYLLVIFSTQLISKSRLSKNSLLVIPLSFVCLFFNEIAISLIVSQSIQLFPKIVLETILCIPVFYLLRVWEERFIPRKEIKLRV